MNTCCTPVSMETDAILARPLHVRALHDKAITGTPNDAPEGSFLQDENVR